MVSLVARLLNRSKNDFVLFAKQTCPYCIQAKKTLDNSEYSWESHDMQKKRELQIGILQMTGHRSVPAIFDMRGDNPRFIGGSDDLTALFKKEQKEVHKETRKGFFDFFFKKK
ncbi:MAG: hypothetical protein HN534_01105 [Euryarchaeota archaeon]|jgi:glutaredoxin|nr:hypothetical protein [Euryarchaeota archaeon]MBT3653519.1 hypothetical protein [Euryarchaeota archaeon]MBT3757623.1 hypothetical protein [Euryarchaeota archaeon]MBT4050903.1 hypothetical protein [Euryarchaeota archaeon]MBT4346503.1 hypothetical protein [Euryarchaeota archaeon]|tara:strand:- start:343 stop:681 length:339 start_codon:yes stop_codon:yes gene_type:complete